MTVRLETAETAYVIAFGQLPPFPWGVSDDFVAEVLEQAITSGVPVPDDFAWWPDMPPDALA